MRRLLLLTAIATIIAATGTTAAIAHTGVTRGEMRDFLRDNRPHTNNVLRAKCRPIYNYTELWKVKALHWTYHVWKFKRHPNAHAASPNCWAVLNSGNFDTVLARASTTFRISYSWIHACSHDEGNTHKRGPIWNSGGSGAFGWMQFMKGTFYGNVDAAFSSARQRGVSIPSRYKRWDSKIGQAYTAAYMFSIGQSGQWTGASC